MGRRMGFQAPLEISSDRLRNRSQSPPLLGFAVCHLRRRLLMVEGADSAALTEIPQDLVCITIVGKSANQDCQVSQRLDVSKWILRSPSGGELLFVNLPSRFTHCGSVPHRYLLGRSPDEVLPLLRGCLVGRNYQPIVLARKVDNRRRTVPFDFHFLALLLEKEV